jgi:hypothetical protein
MKNRILLAFFIFGFFVANAQIDNDAIAKQLVEKNQKNIGLSKQDLSNFIVSDNYIDNVSGARLVYLQQSYLDLPVYNQMQVLAFKQDQLISKSGGRILGIEKITNGNKGIPTISATEAVITALKDRKIKFSKSPMVVGSEKNGHLIVFNNMGIARENITAELMWVPVEDGKKVCLAWQVYVIPNTTSDFWMVRINATDNSVLNYNNLTVYCNWGEPANTAHSSENHAHSSVGAATSINHTNNNLFDFTQNQKTNKFSLSPSVINNATYRVVPYPSESPKHFADTTAIISNPWNNNINTNAASLKWHSNGTTDYSFTKGNNVWAVEDRDGNNATTGSAAFSTSTSDPLAFEFKPNFTQSPTTATTAIPNQQFNITNLFYWNNIIHDITYAYGFDEVSGNFQANNQGRGGNGNDYVLADAQDGAGTNNANFATPADGSSGRMQMYLWNGSPQKDGDVDNGIVVHEYAHGISNRLTGGPAQSGCLSNAEQMGEGWSDYFALMYTQNWAIANLNTGFSSSRPVGTYAIGQAVNGSGIRTKKYCTNFTVNNLVYSNNTTLMGESHNRGELWCAALWDMTWNIITQVGTINPNLYNANAAGGNSIALKLVTEGMKLQPCSPGFIDGRDAILQADQILYNGAYSCAIREAFRRRGMGAFASQGSSGSTTDQVPDFTLGSAAQGLTQSVTEVLEGDNITFTNTLTADACGIVSNFLLTDTLPLNVTYVSGGSYNAANRVVSFPVNLTAGQVQQYQFTVKVNTGAYFPTVMLFEDLVPNGTATPTWTPTTNSTANWAVSEARSFSPTRSYFSSNLDTLSDERLTLTTPISLGGAPPRLTFRHWYNTESTYDGGVLEISTNGGTTWTDVQNNILKGGYIATMDATTILSGRKAWSGSSNNKFIKTIVNLLPYANQNVLFRFRFSSDVGTAVEGWYIDDIAIKNQAVVEMQSNLYNASNVKVLEIDTFTIILPTNNCVNAAINTPPANANVCIGNNATFSTSARGTNNHYQWQVSTDGGSTYNDLANDTFNILTINNVNVSFNNNKYRVLISNDCPSNITSSEATLSVNTPASMVTEPTSQTTCSGTNVTFNAVVNGSANTYQWQVSTNGGSSFTDIAGATSASLTLNNVTSTMNNNVYHLVVASCNPNNLLSSDVSLTVNSAANITTEPINSNGCVGGNATFSSIATGTNVTYQWQVSTDGGVTFANITGATNTSLSLNGLTTLQNNNKYRLIATGNACSNVDTSVSVTLTVSDNAIVTLQPSNVSECPSQNVVFSTTAVGTGITYQWQVSTNGGTSFTNINGQTSATLTLNTITSSMNNNQYRAMINSQCNAVGIYSNPATLTVNALPVVVNQPSDITSCVNSNVTFNADANDVAILTYQWQMAPSSSNVFSNINGATSNSLSLNNIASNMNNNKYRLQISILSGCGPIFTDTVLLHVSSPAAIQTQPIDASVSIGSDATFSVIASGTNISYQWQVSSDSGLTFRDIAGATSSAYLLSGVSINNDNYQYRVVVKETSCGNITSAAAKLNVSSSAFIYPNPTKDNLSVNLSDLILSKENIKITMFDSKGSRVYNQIFAVSKNNRLLNIKTAGLQSGTYFLVLTDNNGVVLERSKIVIE